MGGPSARLTACAPVSTIETLFAPHRSGAVGIPPVTVGGQAWSQPAWRCVSVGGARMG